MTMALAASGILTYNDVDATNGKVVTVGAKTYTLKTGALSVANDVAIDLDQPDATVLNICNAINASGGVPGTDYHAETTRNSAATAAIDPYSNSLVVTARVAGTAGNLIVFTTDEPEFTAPGTLAGGIAGEGVIAWSLVSLQEAKTALRVRNDSADEEIAGILVSVADSIERELGFRPVADLGTDDPEADLTEYHDLANHQGFIYLRRRPVRSVASVTIRGNVLAADRYALDSDSGLIAIIGAGITPVRSALGSSLGGGGGSFVDWPEDVWRGLGVYFPVGVGNTFVEYKGGYASTDTVDGGLKDVALDMAARIYRTRERKSQGLTSEVAAGLAISTKYDPSVMTKDAKARLRSYATLTKTARQ